MMMSLGNAMVNSIYCANTDAKDLVPLTPSSPEHVRHAWMYAKYSKKLIVNHHWKGDDELGEVVFLPESGLVDPDWLLVQGTKAGRIDWICRAIALKADGNKVYDNENGRTPLHLAVLNVKSVSSIFYFIGNILLSRSISGISSVHTIPFE